MPNVNVCVLYPNEFMRLNHPFFLTFCISKYYKECTDLL